MIDMKDVQIYHSWTKIDNHIRATHIPSGLHVTVSGYGYFSTREAAMAQLEEKVASQNLPATAE